MTPAIGFNPALARPVQPVTVSNVWKGDGGEGEGLDFQIEAGGGYRGGAPGEGALSMRDYPAGYWLLKAEEARTKADQVRDAAARATMLEIAERCTN